MALEIVWSDEANEGLDEIIEYLEENWTEKEIHHFFTRLEACLSISKKLRINRRTQLGNQEPRSISIQNTLLFSTRLMIR
ncbi:hypothetical protein RT717_06915 [Imperialibacter roseus]|uniref:Type II toxin-antitoxin system RelE/ParE family toxin n=1 Tax=Imperialibacter roseus TaxID=1324217 RepID=A0ABZ0ITL2_9BACT|nr:hypothetical protein [Imperialibacter roseus]WOK08368.1 hypothetical protein RT717_06915 [Imperialibacter roseus]